jgi:hypothetical protein
MVGLWSLLLRVLVPRLVVFGVTAAIVGLAHALTVDPTAQPSAHEVPAPMPAWTDADQRAHPRCVPSAAWPEGKPADSVVVYSFRDHTRLEVSFAEAWEINHDETEADDTWVVGVCPRHRSR